ncbi:MAG: hypothetical protein P9L92_03460 [Candidatus Electryonea clarkiae]|nr:hypothetical protein [Candidatus Electryonea clarkiae]MDP8285951.1 hypothetical protein [Candidatus Electryonea clarkiae]
MRHVLFSVTGLVPNVITEAFYILRRSKYDTVRIKEIFILTTQSGHDVLWKRSDGSQHLLGKNGVLKQLC